MSTERINRLIYLALVVALAAGVGSHLLPLGGCRCYAVPAHTGGPCSSEVDRVFDYYRDVTERDKCRLLNLHISFVQTSLDSLMLGVSVFPRLADRFTKYMVWLCLPPEIVPDDTNLVWESVITGMGPQVRHVNTFLAEDGIHRVKAYVLGMEKDSGMVPCRSDYWVKTGRGTLLVSMDSTFHRITEVPVVHASREQIDIMTTLDSPKAYATFDKYPEVTKSVSPEYPEDARRKDTEGTVLVVVTIDENGDVIGAWVDYSDDEVLNQAALDAAGQFKFKPASQKGVPIKATISIPFRFSLTD